MIHWLRARLAKDESGFTLIELMVVVLIIAILIAIAIPTFLGARGRAQDRAAQSNARNALTAEKVYYTDNSVYTTDATSLEAIEPSLLFSTAVSATNPQQIGVVTCSSNSRVVVASQSASGGVFSILDIATGADSGTYYASGTAMQTCPTGTPAAPWTTDGF